MESLYLHFQFIGAFIENYIFPTFSLTLKQARWDISPKKYFTLCFISNFFNSLFAFLLVIMAFTKSDSEANPYVVAFIFAVILMFFLFVQQLGYPKMIIKKRINNIERNVLPALQNLTVQLGSGVPLFDIIVNIAASDYGEVSSEFMMVVKKINGGMHQVEAFEKMAIENPSSLFRSAIWQMVNGMKSGAELNDVLKGIMVSLAEEEILQIEQYGAVLSPLTMFYMIAAVILPALGVNFLIVIISFMDIGIPATKTVFFSVYGFILFFQVMFLSIIKSKRPSLLMEA